MFSSLSNFFHLKIMVLPRQTSCINYHVFNFISQFGIYSSTSMIAVVALDRFLHIFCMQNYNSVYTATRFKLSLAIALLLNLYQASAIVINCIINGPAVAGKYTISVSVLCFIFIISLYMGSLVRPKWHNMQVVRNITKTQRSILRIACYVFLLLSRHFVVTVGVENVY